MNIGKGIVAYQGHSFSDGYEAGYAARDKEAEEEKRELVECLIGHCKRYKNLYPSDWKLFKEIQESIYIIEKHTGKTIDEGLK